MTLTTFLQKAGKFEIQAYRKPADHVRLAETHIAYSGSPFQHPDNPDKIILVADPYSQNTFYYEFNKDDIALADDVIQAQHIVQNALLVARVIPLKPSEQPFPQFGAPAM